ncbi:hypothetical protein ACFYNO_29840 [Kitasatospora sp. NPDC006697]|uniref:hypothetical protein n=1 Tax=Kitasatospora sp. NPDC006697 TaxID=3364020 RepID=UPI00367B474B
MAHGVNARELYESLTEYEGEQPYQEIALPWLTRARTGNYPDRLARAAQTDHPWWTDSDGQDLLRELYALSRVNDRFLDQPWRLPLFTALGMTPFDDAAVFDPFLHEITEVDQADDPQAPIRVTGLAWHGLMLGRLLFARAGVRVRAGADHAQRGVADRSPLFWTFHRPHRPTVDLSQGWGSNSQWRTDFRLDYRDGDGDRLNVAGDRPIDGDPELHPDHPHNLSPEERLLTPAERRDLLRHRCLLRTPEAAAELAASAVWERELMPFDWRLLSRTDARTPGGTPGRSC